MTSQKQIDANRRNALRSTGPTTTQGKLRSRRNALKHGLAAETVIEAAEDQRQYKKFQAAVVADYAPQSSVERELVLRVASLLWRLRRSTLIETGLFEIQARILKESDAGRRNASSTQLHRLFGLQPESDRPLHNDRDEPSGANRTDDPDSGFAPSDRRASQHMGLVYLRVLNIRNDAFAHLADYETRLWRQLAQTLLTLRLTRHT